MPQYSNQKKSGCYKKTFFGCAALFLIIFVIIILIIISIELPEIDFTEPEKREYDIEVDSLTNENIINASFSWRFVDNSLRKRKYDLNFRLLEKEVKAAIEQLKDIGRISVFASVSILPGGGISLIGLELLARKFGVKNFTFIPTSFRKKENI